jgi:hypothetical protein
MAFQFRIQLKNVQKPPVWRKVIVPESFTFEQFHLVIQEAFGWGNYHLYQFSPSGYGSEPVIAVPSEDDWEKPSKNASKTKLSSVFKAENQKYTYIYDFGDDWEHSILLEKKLPEKALKATCLTGKGACPPEDCGGSDGYERLKEILKDPSHKEYEEMKEWIGIEDINDRFHPDEFDLDYINEVLAEIE